MVEALTAEEVARLTLAVLTYPEVGGTPDAQAGYLNVTESRTLAKGDYTTAVDRLMAWEMHERAGLIVRTSASRAAEGAVVEMRLGLGPLFLKIPCRVVYVIDEQDRAGFAYGTLPGHPETGEEQFLVERLADGSVIARVTAFSKPATALARLGGPVSRAVQRLMTRRYLDALDAD